jgi:lipopolysaccharide transport system ATP-binding protein
MSYPVIIVEGLSKRYLVGHYSARRGYHATLRDVIVREAGTLARRAVDFARGRQIIQGDEVEEFWALKDVSFEVKEGEVFGIIGRNGAGKSTLLKILSRITEPTKGRALLRGRVASLLEVGTGFHPELTGRENVFLNGAILGMTQIEIRKKLDEIVAFAGVEKFLDTPVKRYSSGMYVRLAFAVAAHLEPEILIVDEVLAVGDAEFQKKCLGKMKDAAREGRTILFVSHNMSAIIHLTTRSILMSEGRVTFVGASSEVVERYKHDHSLTATTEYDVRNIKRRYEGTGDVKILSLRFDRPIPHFKFLEPIQYTVCVRAERPVERLRVGMTIFSVDGSPVGCSFSREISGLVEGDESDLVIVLDSARLAPGNYFCGVSVGRGNNRTSYVDYDIVMDTLFFEVGPEITESGSMAFWAPTWGAISFTTLTIDRKSQSRSENGDDAGGN